MSSLSPALPLKGGSSNILTGEALERYNKLDEEKKKIKIARPAILPHASGFKEFTRKNENATPSGLIMFDVDHFEGDVRKFFEEKVKERVEELQIALAEISASFYGFHVVFKKPSGMTIAEAQQWMAEQLGVEYDEGTFDLARACFVVSEDYVLYQNDDLLFGEIEIPEEELILYNNKTRPLSTSPQGENLNVSSSDIESNNPNSSLGGGREGVSSFALKAFDLCLTETGLTQAEIDIPGERNWHNTLKAILSVGICQIVPKEQLLAVLKLKMPNYSETDDCRRLVSDFFTHYTDPNGRMSLTLRSIYAKALKESTKCDTPLFIGEGAGGEAFALPPLPKLFQILIKAYPEEYRPAVVVSSLIFLGTILSRLRFHYLDGSTQSPSFIGCVSAPQASGKSFTRKLYELLTAPIKAQDKIGRELEREYNEKKKSAKNAKQQPEDPKAMIRLIPATASNAMILKRATYANGLHLCTYAEEIDTLTKGKKAGAWSEKSDLYRMAFDNAEWGQDYMSDNSFSGQVKLFYNLLCCGTPNAVSRFFSDVEDGLVSRVMFVELPDMLGAKMPKFANYTHRELQEIRERVENLFHMEPTAEDNGGNFEDSENEIWVSCKAVDNAVDEWLEVKRQEYLQNQDNPALDVFRRRAAVIGYRAGMVAYTVNNRRNQKLAAEFATWICEFALSNQLSLFGERMNQVMDKAEDRHNDRANSIINSHNYHLLDELPAEFTVQDLVSLRMKHGQTGKCDYIIGRWRKLGIVEHIGHNSWKKL